MRVEPLPEDGVGDVEAVEAHALATEFDAQDCQGVLLLPHRRDLQVECRGPVRLGAALPDLLQEPGLADAAHSDHVEDAWRASAGT